MYYFPQVMDNLLKLSTSHYSAVRSHAQGVLLQCTNLFAHSYKLLLPRLTELLASPDAEVSHEEFKGALYVVLGKAVEKYGQKYQYCSLILFVAE